MGILDKLYKLFRKKPAAHASGRAAAAVVATSKSESTLLTQVPEADPIEIDDQLSGDELWALAMEAANSDRRPRARNLFAAAVRKDPWKYCGVGRGSWKPAKPNQQHLWLSGIADAGFADLAAAIVTPGQPSELSLRGLMSADRRLEEILNETCARLGISRTGTGGSASTVPSMPNREESSKATSGPVFHSEEPEGAEKQCAKCGHPAKSDTFQCEKCGSGLFNSPKTPVERRVVTSVDQPQRAAASVAQSPTGCRKCGRELVFFASGGLGSLQGVFSGGDFLSAARSSMSHSRACPRCRKNYCTACSIQAGDKSGTAYYACPDCGAALGSYGDGPTRV